MELIYAWIEKFRNFKEVELNFSNKFIIKYDNSNKIIKITPNKSYISMYPEHITNINAFVGKNSVGKTNLLDALGLRMDDRNKNAAEFYKKFKRRNKKKFEPYRMEDIEAIVKNSIYFFIYYIGKDDNDQDLFIFEGNDIESFNSILKLQNEKEIGYWKSKYWFALICNYSEGILKHKYDLNMPLGEYETKLHKDGIQYYGNSKSEQDKLVIISLRENLNEKYYDYRSTIPEDDYKISVPRRNAEFQSKLLGMKVKMLYQQLQRPKRLMFLDNKYTLKINYNSSFLTNDIEDDNKLVMQHSYNELNGREMDVCKVLESFVQFYFKSINNIVSDKIERKLDLSKIYIENKSLKGYINYYFNIIRIITDSYFGDKDRTHHYSKNFSALANELSNNKGIKFSKNCLILEITKQVHIIDLLKIIEATIDENIISNLNEKDSLFGNFFDYTIENFSDGETAYLGFYASLYEQVSILTPNKEKYIILLDEPETRMHPELTRNFINELILFLSDLSENKKKFQVIISTHSPFILSDIQSNNILFLEKDNMGYCRPVTRMLNTFGANIHTLLKDGFFMSSTMGEFATSKIKEVISLIDSSNIEDVTEKQKNGWLYIINSIGEPLIKNRVMKMFNDKFQLDYTDLYNENLELKGKIKKYEEPQQILETIEVLKKQIEKLQIHVNELEDNRNDKD